MKSKFWTLTILIAFLFVPRLQVALYGSMTGAIIMKGTTGIMIMMDIIIINTWQLEGFR